MIRIRRPFLWIFLALALGEVLAWWNTEMSLWIVVGMWFPSILFWLRKRKRGVPLRLSAWFLLLPTAAAVGLVLGAAALVETSWEEQLKTEAVSVYAEGEVRELQERDNGFWVFLRDVRLDSGEEAEGLILMFSEPQSVSIGETLRVFGECFLFSEATNPGVFDTRAYYRADGYPAAMKDPQLMERTESSSWLDALDTGLYRFRCLLAKSIQTYAAEEDAGILRAMLLGDRAGMDQELYQLYQQQGIAHILAISGFHISLIGQLLLRLTEKSTKSFRLSVLAAAILVLLYGRMTGNRLSAVRAQVSFLLLLLSWVRGRVFDGASAVGLAGILILFLEPLQLFQASFQLSFSTAVGIYLTAPLASAVIPQKRRLSRSLLQSLMLQLTMMPFVLYHFYRYPLTGILLNPLVLPFCVWVVGAAAGGALLGLFWEAGAVFVMGSGHFVLSYDTALCRLFSRLGGALNGYTGRPSVLRLVIFGMVMGGFLCFLQHRRKKCLRERDWVYFPVGIWKTELVRGVLLGTLLLVSWLWLRPDPVTRLTITMLDVGQGDGILVEIPGVGAILSDAGSSSERELAEYTLEPVLQAKGIGCLEAVLVSHGDVDHVNGVEELLERGKIEIKQVYLPAYREADTDFAELLSLCGDRCSYLSAGQMLSVTASWLELPWSPQLCDWERLGCWRRQEVTLQILHPEQGAFYSDTNSASLTWLLTYGDFCMLFTGDLGTEQESGLVDALSTALARDSLSILKVAHHGSRYSTSREFLELTHPLLAWISCGRNNCYGHPHEETLKRLEEAGSMVERTDLQGAFSMQTDGRTMCGKEG